jgi:intracellular septation protein
MKFLFDFLPILLFFVIFKLYDIYLATAVAIAASTLQVAWLWLQHRKVESMPLVTLALIVVLGGATLVLQDETFIKWKPTAVNWLFGAVFLGSQFIGKKTITERMLGANMALPRTVWSRLNASWVIFFVAMGVVNLYIAFNFDTETWVNFKLFGMMGLTLVFVLGQAFYLARHLKTDGIATKE